MMEIKSNLKLIDVKRAMELLFEGKAILFVNGPSYTHELKIHDGKLCYKFATQTQGDLWMESHLTFNYLFKASLFEI